MDNATPSKKLGRPPSATSLGSANVNYQALAWQAKERIKKAEQAGQKLKIKDAVREIMLESVKLENDSGRPLRQSIVNTKLETAYTEVRKILKNLERGN